MTSPELIETCRELRRNPTQAESILWSRIRTKQLDGLKFRRQHPVAGFILDFYCPEVRLGIELDGNVHKDEGSREYDNDRTQILGDYGIFIIRFWNYEVMQDVEEVLRKIHDVACKQKIELLSNLERK
jgi:type I restriction enzyme M protein